MKAFPYILDEKSHQGMDLRDYFAAKALPAVIADEETLDLANEIDEDFALCAASIAYKFADAMMQVRKVNFV